MRHHSTFWGATYINELRNGSTVVAHIHGDRAYREDLFAVITPLVMGGALLFLTSPVYRRVRSIRANRRWPEGQRESCAAMHALHTNAAA
jgi:hypothetical protein